jgi:hypothetical protein
MTSGRTITVSISIPDILQEIPGRTHKINFVVAQVFSLAHFVWLIPHVGYLFTYL